jgi:hypothetical protein
MTQDAGKGRTTQDAGHREEGGTTHDAWKNYFVGELLMSKFDME